MKCQISWIAKEAGYKPTPDTNEAIGYVYREAYTSQCKDALNGIIKYEKTERFPICAEHATRLTDSGMEHWVFEPFAQFEVIVGNIGTVHTGNDLVQATGVYDKYVELSQLDMGRASGESVTLMKDGEIEREHEGQREG